MSLAIAQFESSNGRTHRFRIDIGVTNRFYGYAIGDRILRENGLALLEEPHRVAPVLPLSPKAGSGRTTIEVPSELFGGDRRYFQLFSYRTQDKIGPAISDIVTVPSTPESPKPEAIPKALPAASSGKNGSAVVRPSSLSTETAMDNQPVYSLPFSYREPTHYSTEMGVLDFLGPIGSIVKGVAKGVGAAVKTLAPVIPAAVGFIAPELAPAAAAGTSVISKLIDSLSGGGGNGSQPITEADIERVASALPAKQADSKKVETLKQILKAALAAQNQHPPASQAMGFNGGYPPFPGRMAMPADVFGRMPDLMTLLSDSMHPETVRAIAAVPMRSRVAIGTIGQGALDAGKYFEGFHQGIADDFYDDDAIAALFRNDRNSPEPPYQREGSVRLKFDDIRPYMGSERSRVLYRIDRDLAFSLTLETPRTVSRGTLQLFVKDPETLEVLVERRYDIQGARSGPLAVYPRLSRQDLRSLKPNEDYLISAVFTWMAQSSRSRRTRRLGTSTNLLVTLVGEYFFDRIEGVEETIALDDPQEYRPYWHKVWQGDFNGGLQSVALDCKYYYVLEPERDSNARMETLMRLENDSGDRRSYRLKTGMVLGLENLERLLAWVSDKPRLSPEKMAALRCCDFRDSFHRLARTQVAFEGYNGGAATLWVYPEIELRRVNLKQVVRSDGNGRVLDLSDRTVYFPVPVSARFVGTQS